MGCTFVDSDPPNKRLALAAEELFWVQEKDSAFHLLHDNLLLVASTTEDSVFTRMGCDQLSNELWKRGERERAVALNAACIPYAYAVPRYDTLDGSDLANIFLYYGLMLHDAQRLTEAHTAYREALAFSADSLMTSRVLDSLYAFNGRIKANYPDSLKQRAAKGGGQSARLPILPIAFIAGILSTLLLRQLARRLTRDSSPA